MVAFLGVGIDALPACAETRTGTKSILGLNESKPKLKTPDKPAATLKALESICREKTRHLVMSVTS